MIDAPLQPSMALTASNWSVEVPKKILQGIRTANTDYESITGGLWLSDSGIEGYLSGKIAEALHVSTGLPVTLEPPVKELLGKLVSKSEVRKAFKKNPRIDVAIWDTSRKIPVGAIEVKKLWSKEPCYWDLFRLAALQKIKSKTVRGGCLAVFLYTDNAQQRPMSHVYERVKNDVESWRKNYFEKNFSGINLLATFIEPYGESPTWPNWQWGGAVIDVRLPRRD
jgi:hypothetical protein